MPATALAKAAENHGMPWEDDYGYAQAVRVGDTVYISGQVSHDDQGNIVGEGDMEAQLRQVYANIKAILAKFDLTMDHIVDETLFLTDLEAATEVAGRVRKEAYGRRPIVASTAIGISRLWFPQLMVEIRCVAKANAQ